MAASPQFHAPVSPDWVFSNNSNVSVAKDRSWFTTYTPFTSHVGSLIGGSKMEVVGIGRVEIPVKLRSRRKGKKHGTIRIDNVLHAPGGICNILGQGDFMNRYVVDDFRTIKDRNGRIVAYGDDTKTLFCPKLSGPPIGPITTASRFLKKDEDSSRGYLIHALWPISERARWQAIRPYTDAEKAWLKLHYKGEFHFLQQHGLSIYKDEDREEGRTLVRSLMPPDAEDSGNNSEDDVYEEDDDDDDDSDNDDANSFLNDLETDPTSHVADYHFSAKQLDWIKSHYRHSGNFLLSYGLKPFDDDDCQEGKSILEAMMSEDD